MQEEDFLRELGVLAFTTRLKRISDKMLQDGKKLYKKLDYEIEPNWYVIFKILQKYGSLSITEIAQKIQISHPSVITMVEKMNAKGFLESVSDEEDQRKRLLSLSAKAINMLPVFEETWKAGVRGLDYLLKDTPILEILDKIEDGLNKKGFKERALQEISHPSSIKHIKTMTTVQLNESFIEVISYERAYASDFARLNYEWLEQYFSVEDHDIEMLENPEQYIIQPGGQIFLATINRRAVGTVALIVLDEDTFELAKMAVSPEFKGKKIGKRLMLCAIDYAIKVGKKRLILESNTKLTPALNLYLKMGFKIIPLDPNSPYHRANIRMEMIL